MSKQEATEFEAHISRTGDGDWQWRISTVNGRWPYALEGRDSPRTQGKTWTKWGARVEARRCLRRIQQFLHGDGSETVRL